MQPAYTRGDPILHIELRRWADVVLVAPCSANTLAKIAGGICDNLAVSPNFPIERGICFEQLNQTSLLRALEPSTPTYLFPAMNTHMYNHPLTARHLEVVTDVIGYTIVGPIGKGLACGDVGVYAAIYSTQQT
jgi:phosphopantothenoylcysteine decarboxylase